ncbi:MAG: DNA-binding transcriptional regulator [Verrucomicrobiota bacterium]
MSISNPQVALLVETSLGSGREILRGIASFARQNGSWELFHAARGLDDPVPEWLENWEGHGIIARIQNEEIAIALKKMNVPIIDVLGVCPTGFPLVHVDDEKIASRAAAHLWERGFQHFAYFGMKQENWSQRRQVAFRAATAKAASFHALEIGDHAPAHFETTRLWVSKLPKPAGIMVCSDQRGLLLLEACRAEGISIPEDIAIVGVDNDTTLCEVAAPSLSSVRGGHARVGFEAARLLNRWIQTGDSPEVGPHLVSPNEVITRSSTDSRAVNDPAIRNAMRHIRLHLAEPITNETIAAAVGLSRTRFQTRFRKATGLTVREFLTETRLKRATQLITSTDLTFADIAERTGFRHHEYLGYILKQKMGQTPSELRRGHLSKTDEPRPL